MRKTEVVLFFCCLLIISLIEFSNSDSGYDSSFLEGSSGSQGVEGNPSGSDSGILGYCGEQEYGVCEICECGQGYPATGPSGTIGAVGEPGAPYTGAVITGFAVAEGENCYVEPKPKGTSVAGEEGDFHECKMCDGFGGISADVSKDGQACKYIETTGVVFTTKTVLDGICRNGDCVLKDSCFSSGTYSKTIKFDVTGNPFSSDNNELYLKKRKEAKEDPQYKQFEDCVYPETYKCPPATAPSGTECHTEFPEGDSKISTSSKNAGQEKECSGMKIGSFKATSGNCYSKDEANEKLLADMNSKMDKKVREFREDSHIKETCPSECTVKTESKVSNIEKTVLYAANWATATVNYKIYCTGKINPEEKNEVTVYFSETKYCMLGKK